MYHVVNNSTGITVARFADRKQALHWVAANDTLPAPRTAEQVRQDVYLDPVQADPHLYRVVKTNH